MTEANDIYDPKAFISTQLNEVDLLNPDPDTIDIRDIAKSLSQVNRYTGHTDFPIPVITHLTICDLYAAVIMENESPLFRLALLLHDAHEAYTGDICRPVKRMINARTDGLLEEIEGRLDKAIWTHLGLGDVMLGDKFHDDIKFIDNIALSTEVRLGFPVILTEERWSSLPSVPRDFLRLAQGVIRSDPRQLADGYVQTVGVFLQQIADQEAETNQGEAK